MPVEVFSIGLSPPCRAVMVLAKHIGLDYKTTYVDLTEGAQMEPKFLKMNPFHKIPVINDNGFTLNESRTIMVYLLNKYAPKSDLYPKDLQQRAIVDSMLDFDNGSLDSVLHLRLTSNLYTGIDAPEGILATGKDHLKCLDNLLSTRKYAAGDKLTVADISIMHTLSIIDILEDNLDEYENLTEYRKRVRKDLGKNFTEMNDLAVEQLRDIIKDKKASVA